MERSELQLFAEAAAYAEERVLVVVIGAGDGRVSNGGSGQISSGVVLVGNAWKFEVLWREIVFARRSVAQNLRVKRCRVFAQGQA